MAKRNPLYDFKWCPGCGDFGVKVADYNIEIPQLLFQNIAEQVEVTVDFTYKPM